MKDSTQRTIMNAVKKYNGRTLLFEVRSKLKTEKPKIALNDPRYHTLNDELMKLKAIASQNKLFK